MSEEGTNATPSLEEHVQAELTAAQKSFKISVVAIALMAIVIIVYFQWFKSKAVEILDPPGLAAMLVNESVRILPLLQDSIEASLTATIPAMAQEVMDITVKESVPSLRRNAVSEFNSYSDQLTDTGAAATTEAFTQMIQDNPQAYLDVSGAPPGTLTNKAPKLTGLDRLIDLEVTKCRSALQCHKLSDNERKKAKSCDSYKDDFKACTNRQGFQEDAAQSLEASRQSLANINENLQKKAEGDTTKKDRRSVLTYKLVTAWYSMVKDNKEPSLSSAAMGLQPKKGEDLK